VDPFRPGGDPIMILCANPSAGVQKHRKEIDSAIRGVIDGGRYILGEEVLGFEREFAAYCGSKEAVGVSSGTDGLVLALMALGIRPGDEVITVSHTAVATVSAIAQAGASPVLIDIDSQTYTMNPALLEQAVGPRTKAIIPVHLYGHPVSMEGVMEVAAQHGISVIEDCSQAHGALWRGKRVGTIGAMGVFSCYPTKNLGGIGDGGVVVTSDSALAIRLRELREYGWRDRYNSAIHGVNSRLDELQAAILRVRLDYLDEDNQSRRDLAKRYTSKLGDLPIRLPLAADDVEVVQHLYVIELDDRDRIQRLLAEQGINCIVHYPFPVHLQDGYRNLSRCPESLSNTEHASKRVLSLPIYPELTLPEQDQVIRSLKEVLGKEKASPV